MGLCHSEAELNGPRDSLAPVKKRLYRQLRESECDSETLYAKSGYTRGQRSRHAAQITSHDPLYARVNAKLKMSATRFLSDFFFFFLDVSLQMKQ